MIVIKTDNAVCPISDLTDLKCLIISSSVLGLKGRERER